MTCSTPTVYVLDPAFFPGITAAAFGGWARRVGTVERIDCGVKPCEETAERGAAMIEHVLTTRPGPAVVLGWSLGAQVIYRWLRDHGPASTVDPARVLFISIGNPERRYGGATVVPDPPRKLFGLIDPKASYGGPGIPADTKFRVFDLVRQYDGWADVPTVTDPCPLSLGAISDGIHMDYGLFDRCVTIDNPTWQTYTEGTITYGLLPTRILNAWDRDRIEADFQRPPYRPGGLCLPIPGP